MASLRTMVGEEKERKVQEEFSDFLPINENKQAICNRLSEFNKGRTSGSRVQFYREADQEVVLLHKPHPGDVMKQGAVKQLFNFLTDLGEL